MKKILVPIDYSSNSLNALHYALELAKIASVDILAYHSYEIMAYAGMEGTPVPYLHETIRANEIEERKRLEEAVQNFILTNDVFDVKIESLLESGSVISNLKALVNENKDSYYMVVMGTKGATSFPETFLGTVTASVVENVNVPVLVVPENAKFVGIDKIVYASNFDIKETDEINNLLTFSEILEATVTCLHINIEQEKLFDDDCKMFDLEKLYKFTSFDKLKFELLEEENIEKSLQNYMEGATTEILAVKPQQYGFLKGLFHSSLTQKLAYHTSVPLLVLKN